MAATTIIVIDPDVRRRASIVHTLSSPRLHIEPFGTLSEVVRRWPDQGVILIHDDPGAIAGVLAEMSARGIWFPIIGYSEDPTTERIVSAVFEGALEYVSFPIQTEEMRRAVASAKLRAKRQGKSKLQKAAARSRLKKLTKREREVLAAIADGLSNRRIGDRLSISPRTVEIHRSNMLGKLGANHTAEAIRLAIEANMLD